MIIDSFFNESRPFLMDLTVVAGSEGWRHLKGLSWIQEINETRDHN